MITKLLTPLPCPAATSAGAEPAATQYPSPDITTYPSTYDTLIPTAILDAYSFNEETFFRSTTNRFRTKPLTFPEQVLQEVGTQKFSHLPATQSTVAATGYTVARAALHSSKMKPKVAWLSTEFCIGRVGDKKEPLPFAIGVISALAEAGIKVGLIETGSNNLCVAQDLAAISTLAGCKQRLSFKGTREASLLNSKTLALFCGKKFKVRLFSLISDTSEIFIKDTSQQGLAIGPLEGSAALSRDGDVSRLDIVCLAKAISCAGSKTSKVSLDLDSVHALLKEKTRETLPDQDGPTYKYYGGSMPVRPAAFESPEPFFQLLALRDEVLADFFSTTDGRNEFISFFQSLSSSLDVEHPMHKAVKTILDSFAEPDFDKVRFIELIRIGGFNNATIAKLALAICETAKKRTQTQRLYKAMRSKLFEANAHLATFYAGMLARGSNCDIKEAISIGNVGLLVAIDAFDPYSGSSFSRFSKTCITGKYLKEDMSEFSRPAALPAEKALAKNIIYFSNAYFAEHGLMPTPEVISDELGAPIEAVTNASMFGSVKMISLTNETPDDSVPSYGDRYFLKTYDSRARLVTTQTPEDEALVNDSMDFIDRVIMKFVEEKVAPRTHTPERTAAIFRRAIIGREDLSEIAKDFNLTRAAISATFLKVLREVQEKFAKEIIELGLENVICGKRPKTKDVVHTNHPSTTIYKYGKISIFEREKLVEDNIDFIEGSIMRYVDETLRNSNNRQRSVEIFRRIVIGDEKENALAKEYGIGLATINSLFLSTLALVLAKYRKEIEERGLRQVFRQKRPRLNKIVPKP